MMTAIFGQVKRMQHDALIWGTALVVIVSIVSLITIGAGRTGTRSHELETTGRPVLVPSVAQRFYVVKQRQLERSEQLAGREPLAGLEQAQPSSVVWERYLQFKQRELERRGELVYGEPLAGMERVQPLSPMWEPHLRFKQRQFDRQEAVGR